MVGLAAVLLAPGLGRAPLDDPGEGQHAEIAREMLGGSRITPRLNGVRYFDKPPLLYWLTAASFHQWGLTEGAARLAPLLGALLAVAGTTLLGVRLLGLGGGLLAGAALLSCALFAAFARYLRPETLFVAAIQWGLLRGPRNGPRTPPVADNRIRIRWVVPGVRISLRLWAVRRWASRRLRRICWGWWGRSRRWPSHCGSWGGCDRYAHGCPGWGSCSWSGWGWVGTWW